MRLTYRFASEDTPPLKMRLKIEIDTREHFTELGLVRHPVEVLCRWFSGVAEITTFSLPEILGTKLRALYQRKKGRDLFDLWFALRHADVEVDSLLRCFHRYMAEGGHAVTRAQFEANLSDKARDPDFRDDIAPLLRQEAATTARRSGRRRRWTRQGASGKRAPGERPCAAGTSGERGV